MLKTAQVGGGAAVTIHRVQELRCLLQESASHVGTSAPAPHGGNVKRCEMLVGGHGMWVGACAQQI